LAAAVTRINHQNKKDNTTFAYEPKVAEFYSYCQHRYSGVHESLCYTVTTGKLYEFLFYHSMRNIYKQVGKRKKGAHGGFDSNDFDIVLQMYGCLVASSSASTSANLPDPKNPVGYDLVTTYKSVVYNIWMTQVANQSK
jgi:hypothetical protein